MKDVVDAFVDISSDSDLSPKGKIIRVAEKLFSEKGVENTSLREIAEQSGNKNPNAVQYHFDSKDGLIRAIWQRHSSKVNLRRQAFIDTLDSKPTLNQLVKAFVLPVIACLKDNDGGQYYLMIMSQLVSYKNQNLLELFFSSQEDAITLLFEKMEPYLNGMDDADRIARMLVISGMLFHGLSDYVRLKNANDSALESIDDSKMTHHLICMIEASISAPC